jgi:hypothetical protein
MTDEYFNLNEACSLSKTLLEHNRVIIVRCGLCKKLNPNYIERPPVKISECVRFKPPPGIKMIEIRESLGTSPGHGNPLT